jgi:hypothetical protein
VIDWHEKGHGALKIYQKLSTRPGGSYPTYSTITDCIKRLQRSEDITRRASDSGRLLDEQIHILIAAALEEAPFHSVPSLASAIKYLRTTVWRYLHAVSCTERHLHLVARMLTPAQKAEKVETAWELKKCDDQPSIEVHAIS